MSGWQPRQRRAVETRRRILQAALVEMAQAGIDNARVEDIVARAGVGWGSFYRYFSCKEDVLLDAAATVAEVFAGACEVGMAAGRPFREVVTGAFWRAASAAPYSAPLWDATFRALSERPQRVDEMLAARKVAQPVDVLAELIGYEQLSGRVRDDQPAHLLAGVIVTAVWANALREGPVDVMVTPAPEEPTRAPGAGPGAGFRARRSRRSLAVELLFDGLLAAPGAGRPGAGRPGGPDRGSLPSLPDLPGRIGRARTTRAPDSPD